jgi:acetyl-CoA carboxylase biotin carboxylase subunit
MLNKVLIANRGEIALRVIRACKEEGVKTVAVYSDADKDSLHVKRADEAINIGPPLARKSYLNIEKIIEAAKKVGAEAIHPGYGFLAENVSFVKACEENGIKFIGPSSETQRLAGDKIMSRKMAARVGIPVSPGSEGAVSPEEAVEIAEEVGYPVIIKASGGGGGKGMRIAYNGEELLNFMKLSKGEAGSAFGNPDLYVERYIVEPHHIEIQILGDEYGNYIHLAERECSIQRSFQKLIEESPSPFVDEELRKRLGETAIAAARSVGYANAGTVEFLVDKYRNFYFNEINSRLQVEHPVTEMVTGIDLLRQQLKIAAGERLELTQEQIVQNGWSIECRINAEDPDNAFKPMPGVIEQLILPGGPGVRVDTHLYIGYEIPPFYDSLVGKLVVWGENRQVAIKRMKRALDEFQIEGLKTTIPFHKKVMLDEDFIKGNINTHFLRKFLSRGGGNG